MEKKKRMAILRNRTEERLWTKKDLLREERKEGRVESEGNMESRKKKWKLRTSKRT